jgi:hypothetical protein
MSNFDINGYENLPDAMLKATRWLVWKEEPCFDKDGKPKKPRKVPYYVNGSPRNGELDSERDIKNLSSISSAYKALKLTGKYTGIGFAFGADGETGNYFQGIDIDKINEHPELLPLVEDMPGYVEKSPSGNGYHVIGYGKRFDALASNSSGIEAYSYGRYFTVTGEAVSGFNLVDLSGIVESRLAPLHRRSTDRRSDIERNIETVDIATIRQLREALDVFSADDRERWIRYGQALCRLGGIGRSLWMGWSAQSLSHDPLNDSKTWDSFKGDRTGYPAIFKDAYALGWDGNKKIKDKNNTGFSFVDGEGWIKNSDDKFDLSKFSLFGQTEAMKQKMITDVFVLKDIAILGQATVIYAQFNTGKTLLTLWMLAESIKEHRIKGEDVFYINADDTYNGLVTKNMIAEKYGFHQLAPNINGFDPSEFISYMKAMVDSDVCHGKIIVLDTLKKFTDLMSKKVGSEFGVASRQFVQAGGTLIMLAHTNKHKDQAGKLVYGGTNDIPSDTDCVFTVDSVKGFDGDTIQQVIFERIKSRGNVAQEVSFSYLLKAPHYHDLMDSVIRIDSESAKKEKQRGEDKKGIDAIISIIEYEVINNGNCLKTHLIDEASCSAGLSKKEITRILDYYNGEIWEECVGVKHSKSYRIIGKQ